MAPQSGDFGYFGDYKMWRRNINVMPARVVAAVG